MIFSRFVLFLKSVRKLIIINVVKIEFIFFGFRCRSFVLLLLLRSYCVVWMRLVDIESELWTISF